MNSFVYILLFLFLLTISLGLLIYLLYTYDINAIRYNNDKNESEMLSDPNYDIKEISNFLSDEECKALINVATKKGLTESKLFSETKDTYDNNVRKSEQAWLYDSDNEVVDRLSKRIAELVKLPVENQEALQVVHYGVGGKYEPHYDACISKTSCERMNKRGGHRYLTVLVYLNTVPSGGGTYFPYLNKTVKAEKGKVVIFQNTETKTQEIIKQAKHGGNPVLEGEKWIANKWIHFNSIY